MRLRLIVRGVQCYATALMSTFCLQAAEAPSPMAGAAEIKPPGCSSESVTGTEGEPLTARDEAYAQLLDDLDRMISVWTQQPRNRQALQRYAASIRSHVTDVRRVPAQPTGEEVGKRDGAEATFLSSVEEPEGPMSPSDEPSSEEEMERRRRATEDRLLKGPKLDKASLSLVGVPQDWIEDSCSRSMGQLDLIESQLKTSDIDQPAFEEALGKLKRIVMAFDTPPPKEPSLTTGGDRKRER